MTSNFNIELNSLKNNPYVANQGFDIGEFFKTEIRILRGFRRGIVANEGGRKNEKLFSEVYREKITKSSCYKL